jgi:hypothetical protein
MLEDDEEEDVIYHGTTLEVANKIVAAKMLEQRESWFSSTKELAFYFADRACKKRGSGVPAILRIVLYRSDLKDWIKGRLVSSIPFDETDAAGLRGKMQLVFSGDAIRLLNTHSFKDTWHVEMRGKKETGTT